MAMARVVTDLVAGVKDPHTEPSAKLLTEYRTPLNYRYDLNVTNQPFPSFEAKFPEDNVWKGTKYTSLMRWNVNDSLYTINNTFGIEITGYGTLSNATQHFAAEDIVLLYDGYCASTCSLASTFLRHQGKVKSVAMGGRPSHKGKIQGVGGVKGAQVFDFLDIYDRAVHYNNSARNGEERNDLLRFSDLLKRRSISATLNVRDQILPESFGDGIPAQFVNETADFRLYWTEEMVRDIGEVWKAVTKVAFGGEECVAGGIERTVLGIKSEKKAGGEGKRVLEGFEKERSTSDDDDNWLAVYRMRVVD
ncbi:hypothetical protein QBC38DRAFT_191754 [Podospora fimiseda]|uniref:Uncharacterized protein n=1 Tax=Podospora fimiseda TaxID=252190 RepID=A0AAN7BQU5_9PEZI|nr:hypothetical protein QBC38DRAFT_191754 [Podospora fimiseda]